MTVMTDLTDDFVYLQYYYCIIHITYVFQSEVYPLRGPTPLSLLMLQLRK